MLKHLAISCTAIFLICPLARKKEGWTLGWKTSCYWTSGVWSFVLFRYIIMSIAEHHQFHGDFTMKLLLWVYNKINLSTEYVCLHACNRNNHYVTKALVAMSVNWSDGSLQTITIVDWLDSYIIVQYKIWREKIFANSVNCKRIAKIFLS